MDSAWMPWFAVEAPPFEQLATQKAAVLLRKEDPAPRDTLSPRPWQMDADCVGKVFYEADRFARRHTRKDSLKDRDRWVNGGGKRARFKFLQFSLEEEVEEAENEAQKKEKKRTRPRKPVYRPVLGSGLLYQVVSVEPTRRNRINTPPSPSDDGQESEQNISTPPSPFPSSLWSTLSSDQSPTNGSDWLGAWDEEAPDGDSFMFTPTSSDEAASLHAHAEGAELNWAAEQRANDADGSVKRPLELPCVDVRSIFQGKGASEPVPSPMTLKRKLAGISMALMASCAVIFSGSSPSVRPELARRLLDSSTLSEVDVQYLRDGCTWMYYNPDDPELVIGTSELRRCFIRTMNIGHPLLLQHCILYALLIQTVCNPVARMIQLKMLDIWPQPNGAKLALARTMQMILVESVDRQEQQSPSDGVPSMLKIGCMGVVMSHFQAIHMLTSTRFPLVLMLTLGLAAPLLFAQAVPQQSIAFTIAYRLVGLNQVSLGVELSGLALKAWTDLVPSINVGQLVEPLQIGPVAIDMGSIDAGALQHFYCHPAAFREWLVVWLTVFNCRGLLLLAIFVLVARSRSPWATAAIGIGPWLCARMYSALIGGSIIGDGGSCLGDAFGEVSATTVWRVPRYAIEWTTATSFALVVSWFWGKMLFNTNR